MIKVKDDYMKESFFEVKPIGVKYLCDCGSEMFPTGAMILCDPPQFTHKCSECEKTVKLLDKYPTIRWQKVSE